MAIALVVATGLGVAGCKKSAVEDEATQAGLSDAHFKQAGEDYFKAMDNGVELNDAEVKGRNMWNVWTGGNDRFWDTMSKPTFGGFDLLKIVAGRPGTPHGREQRWQYLGLINEPCFTPAAAPDPKHFGLYIDQRSADCPADPFADEKKYPGVKI
ncbi:MAG TPA: hypothetical protein PK808_08650, partial [Polymorphobacter sp.]|nr:hypothetical protein [Polymorphobacter sp.]